MTFPVPKDVRGTRDFELVKGTDEMMRTPLAMADTTKAVAVGEWVKLNGSGEAAKLAVGVDVEATPALGAFCSWTNYVPSDMSAGQADAQATKQIDALSGKYQAKTKLYDTGATYVPGAYLVAIYDADLGGILFPLDPAGTPTTRQMMAAVGKVIQVANGQLWFETL